MAESSQEPFESVRKGLELHYSVNIAQQAVQLYKRFSDEYKIYIVGCLILTLTASVKPEYTLLKKRKANLASAGLYSAEQLEALADAGLYLEDKQQPQSQRRLVCFHCSAKIASDTLDGLSDHRQASPGCYFVRLFDFVNSKGEDSRLSDSLPRDIGRYVKALRKLKSDLSCEGINLAESYGYSKELLRFCTARHFMRNSGRVPDRAGDLIQLVHNYESLFDPSVPTTTDILSLLEPLKLLSATSSNRTESGYHSVVVGQFDQRSGALQSSVHSVTREQLQAIQAMLGSAGGGAGGGALASSASAGSFNNG